MLTSRAICCIGMLTFVCSQFSYADTFKEGGDAYKAGNFATAAKKFLEVAEKGDHRAMYALGSMYAGGSGVDKDYRKAYKWFARAAKYGRLDAQYKLGLMHDEGLGVPQNYRRAARLYSKPAKKGYARAQFRLGLLYAKGNGLKQSKVKAYAWIFVANQNLMQDPLGKKLESADAQQQKGNIFTGINVDIITAELEKIKANMVTEELAEAMQLAEEYSRY